MKLLKRSERKLRTSSYLQAMRAIGGTTKHIQQYKKWKVLDKYNKISVSLDVYYIELSVPVEQKFYMLSDTLGNICTQPILDKMEILSWLKEHGYMTDKEFYLADGMDEETWEEWNK